VNRLRATPQNHHVNSSYSLPWILYHKRWYTNNAFTTVMNKVEGIR
jgi:hypothetical protein